MSAQMWNNQNYHTLLAGVHDTLYNHCGNGLAGFFKKLNIPLPHKPEISLLGTCQRELRTYVNQKTKHTQKTQTKKNTSTLFAEISSDFSKLGTTHVSTNEKKWINTGCHKQSRDYLAIKRNMVFLTYLMNLKNTRESEKPYTKSTQKMEFQDRHGQFIVRKLSVTVASDSRGGGMVGA